MTIKNTILFLSIFLYDVALSEKYSATIGAKDTKLYGISGKGTIYSIQAKNIIEINKDKYQLTTIYSKYYLDVDKEKYLTLTSKFGVFDTIQNFLHLYGNVEINVSEGYRMLTDKLDIDFKKMLLITNEKIEIHGIKGKIFAEQGLTYNINKKQSYLKGPITSLILSN